VRQEEIIRLNTEQSRLFAEALLAMPRPVPDALRRAHKEYGKRVVKHL